MSWPKKTWKTSSQIKSPANFNIELGGPGASSKYLYPQTLNTSQFANMLTNNMSLKTFDNFWLFDPDVVQI